jgi:hypothetical protein
LIPTRPSLPPVLGVHQGVAWKWLRVDERLWRRPSLTDPARGGPMRPRVGTKGWAPLEVEQKDEKDKKERKKDAVVQNWCLTSRAPYKGGADVSPRTVVKPASVKQEPEREAFAYV